MHVCTVISIWMGEQKFPGSILPGSKILPLVRYAYLVLRYPNILTPVYSKLVCIARIIYIYIYIAELPICV